MCQLAVVDTHKSKPRVYMRMVPVGSQESHRCCQICPSFIPFMPKFMLLVKLFLTDKIFLTISHFEKLIVAKILKTFLCKNHTHTHKTMFPVGKSICQSSLTDEFL